MAAPSLVFLTAFLALPVRTRSLLRDASELEQSRAQELDRDAADLGNACRTGDKSGSGWRPANQTFNGGKNMCLNGKLVPQLYVLGAPKCATTSFAFEFAGAGAECAAGTKEYHFWTPDTVKRFEKNHESTTKDWLKPLPDCDHKTRRVVADFTPEYLSLTPRNMTHHTAEGFSLPGALKGIYGSKAKQLQFVVMVREPLSRMHSWWYYCKKNDGFQAHAEDELRRGSGSLWHSTYGQQMKFWTEIYSMNQFYVIPFKLFSGKTSNRICQDISDRLHFTMACSAIAIEALHGSHPQLEQDTTQKFRDFFDTSMAPDRELLVDVLAKGSTEGMGLPHFTGRAGEALTINRWLTKYW